MSKIEKGVHNFQLGSSPSCKGSNLQICSTRIDSRAKTELEQASIDDKK